MAALLGIVAFHTLKSRTLDAIQSEAVNYGHAHSVAIGNWFEDRKHAVDALAAVIARDPDTRPWCPTCCRPAPPAVWPHLFWFGAGEMTRHDPPSTPPTMTPGPALVPERRQGGQAHRHAALCQRDHAADGGDPGRAGEPQGPGDRGGRGGSLLDALIDEVLAMKVQGRATPCCLDRTGLIVGHPNRSWRSNRWRSWIPASPGRRWMRGAATTNCTAPI